MNGLAYERLHSNLVTLKLHTIDTILDNYLELATKEEKPIIDILDHLVTEELKARKAASVETCMKLAGFPVKKTIEDFDFAFQPSIDRAAIKELSSLRFVQNAESVVFLGPPGVGKTHLAIGLGIEAVKQGFSAYYLNAATLIDQLRRADERDQLEKKIRWMARFRVLIIDEIGYLPMDRKGANLFFQLVSKRYEKASTIFTSNKPYSEWGEILGDSVIAAATLDRILHHSTTVTMKGDSYRLKSRKQAGLYVPSVKKKTGGEAER